MNSKLTRNLGLDCLRICAIFLVVTMHICTQGGILDALSYGSANYYCAWVLICITYCANNVFALISGYFYDASDRRAGTKVLSIWVQLLFYTIGISALFFFIDSSNITANNILKALTPITSRQYWYISCYVGLLFIKPLLDHFLDGLQGERLHLAAGTVLIVFSVLPTLRHTDPFGMNDGWSVAWLGMMYFIGGYLKKTKLPESISKGKAVLGFILSVMIAASSKFFIEAIVSGITGGERIAGGGYLISLTSPVIIAEAVLLLSFFEKVTVSEPKKKIVTLLSDASLGVYIIHQHPFIKHFIISDRFIDLADKSVVVLICGIILSAAAVFSCSAIVDIFRGWLFRKLCVNEKIKQFCSRFPYENLPKQ